MSMFDTIIAGIEPSAIPWHQKHLLIRVAGVRTAEMTSIKQRIQKKLLNVSLVLNGVSLAGLAVMGIFISLLSQRTAKLESDIAVEKDDLYAGN